MKCHRKKRSDTASSISASSDRISLSETWYPVPGGFQRYRPLGRYRPDRDRVSCPPCIWKWYTVRGGTNQMTKYSRLQKYYAICVHIWAAWPPWGRKMDWNAMKLQHRDWISILGFPLLADPSFRSYIFWFYNIPCLDLLSPCKVWIIHELRYLSQSWICRRAPNSGTWPKFSGIWDRVPLVLNSAPSANSLLEETTQFMNNSGKDNHFLF